METSNPFSPAVEIGFTRIRVPHLDARQRRANEIGHPATPHTTIVGSRTRPTRLPARPRRQLLHGADNSFQGVSDPFQGADVLFLGAGGSFQGASGPFQGMDRSFLGVDESFQGASGSFRGMDDSFLGANGSFLGMSTHSAPKVHFWALGAGRGGIDRG